MVKIMNDSFNRFWLSFTTWFLQELPYESMLKSCYMHYSDWNNGSYYVDIDYDHEYKLNLGTEYPKTLDKESISYEEFKVFIELIYERCIEKRYDFTVAVNNRLKGFRVPLKLQSGKLIKEGYKTTFELGQIINYETFERKIKFSEEMISSKEFLDKKVALDYIIDSLQYLLSVNPGKTVKTKYESAALQVGNSKDSKVFTVINNELDEIMKIANEFFDIRHNEYLNKSKEKREILNDKAFIEYLYNRVYTMLYLLRIKTNPAQLLHNNTEEKTMSDDI